MGLTSKNVGLSACPSVLVSIREVLRKCIVVQCSKTCSGSVFIPSGIIIRMVIIPNTVTTLKRKICPCASTTTFVVLVYMFFEIFLNFLMFFGPEVPKSKYESSYISDKKIYWGSNYIWIKKKEKKIT